ncbi:hypothetical protein SDC9_69098 [bioreactor metagenome]|uniref:Uncharacterized protein n=1 Tax=bioreactor metagenome TaxID=1076179 RepID=A0A644Y279_9ZZZZ
MKKNTNTVKAIEDIAPTNDAQNLRLACDAIVTNAMDIGGGKFARIPCNLLQMDDYQRTEDHAASLAKRWDEKKCLPLLVSYRDGKFFVVDGQNRLAAAKLIGQHDIKCIINEMSYDDEAIAFARQDDGVKRVTAYQKMCALSKAGEHPYTDIATICENQRIRLVNSRRPGIGECGSASKLLEAYRRSGRDGLIWILTTIRYIGWSVSHGGYSSDVLVALCSVYVKSGNVNMHLVCDRIKDAVGNMSPDMTISKAHSVYPGRINSSALAEYFLAGK